MEPGVFPIVWGWNRAVTLSKFSVLLGFHFLASLARESRLFLGLLFVCLFPSIGVPRWYACPALNLDTWGKKKTQRIWNHVTFWVSKSLLSLSFSLYFSESHCCFFIIQCSGFSIVLSSGSRKCIFSMLSRTGSPVNVLLNFYFCIYFYTSCISI